MNNGAFGENFPYSNFHDLNMDWIIKIAKDFLDQYTNIQQTITDGLEALDNKAETLEALLQQWYDTHSEDIANQLADALNDLNTWYTSHVEFLDQYVASAIASFNSSADQKAQQTIATIPDDYTTLSNNVLKLLGLLSPYSFTWTQGAVSNTTGNEYWATNAIRTGFIEKPNTALTSFYVNPNKRQLDIYIYDVSQTFLTHYDCGKKSSGILYFPSTAVYFRFVMTDQSAIVTSYADGFYSCSGLEEINNDVFKALKISNTLKSTADFTGNYSDMDTFPINEIVLINGATSNTLAHCPTNPFTGYVTTINYHGNQLIINRDFSIQIAVNLFDNVNPGINNMYYRSKYSSWSDWKMVNEQFFEAYKGLKGFTLLGDSISVSISYPTLSTGIIVKSWESIMAESMNVTPDVYAYGGITTGGMLTNADYNTAIANNNNKQFAIIFLGINDINEGITLNTFENNYRQIISDLLLNHKFVFCVNIPAGLKNNDRNNYNATIKTICDGTNKAFLLDLNSYSEYTSLLAHNGHMSSTGYAIIANMIEKLIDKVLTTDSYFINGTMDT